MSMRKRLDAVVDRAVDDIRTIVGAVILVARNGELVYARTHGYADREAKKPVAMDTIFRLASVTKPLVAAATLAMVEQELLALDDEVATYLPYFTPKSPDGVYRPILIRHLLSHTSGLGYDYSADPQITTGLQQTDFDYEQNFSLVARLPLSFAPGTGWQYSTAIDVLAAIICKITAGTLEQAVGRYVTGPLEMTDTGFHVTDPSRLAVPYGDARPEPERMGDPHTIVDDDGGRTVFQPGRIFNPKAFQSGGAGAVGTAPDFMKFLEAIRQGGAPILKPETVAVALANQVGDLPRRPRDAGQRFGFLGAIVVDPIAAHSPVAAGTVRWGGVYGHEWFIDRQNGLSVAGFTNTAKEGCDGQFRYDVRDAVYG